MSGSGGGTGYTDLVDTLTADVYFKDQPWTNSNDVAMIYTFNVSGMHAFVELIGCHCHRIDRSGSKALSGLSGAVYDYQP